MNEKIKDYLGITLIIGIILFTVAGFWYVSSVAKTASTKRVFSVQGEGKVVAVPDVAQLSFGIITEGGQNLEVLQKQNTEKTNSILAFLKKEGMIDEKDIKTEFYNISPRYQYYSCSSSNGGPCPPSEIVGYSINQSIRVKIRDLDKVGDILTAVVVRGATSISGPTFTVDDPAELENQARAEAINQAKEKAKVMSEAGEFRLGKIISIDEGISLPQPLRYDSLSLQEMGMGGASPEVEPGSQEIRVSINITYEIK